MSKYFWPSVIILIVALLVVVAVVFFRVDTTTYQKVQRTDSLHIDTNQPLVVPNGRRPQDPAPGTTTSEPNDRTFGTVFPYFAAPHQ